MYWVGMLLNKLLSNKTNENDSGTNVASRSEYDSGLGDKSRDEVDSNQSGNALSGLFGNYLKYRASTSKQNNGRSLVFRSNVRPIQTQGQSPTLMQMYINSKMGR